MLALLSSIFSLLSAFSSIVLAVSLRIIYVPVSSALALSVSAVETTVDYQSKASSLLEDDPMFAALSEICSRHGGLWSGEAEDYLLAHARSIG